MLAFRTVTYCTENEETPEFNPPISIPAVEKSTGDTLQTQYENYAESLFLKSGVSTIDSQQRDCLGQNTSSRLLSRKISSIFFVRNGSLMCTGVAGIAQPIVSNVTDFSIRLIAVVPGTDSNAPRQLQYVTPRQMDGEILKWENIHSVEVCIELTSPTFKAVDIGSSYRKCNNELALKKDKLILVNRQTFNPRAHGA